MQIEDLTNEFIKVAQELNIKVGYSYTLLDSGIESDILYGSQNTVITKDPPPKGVWKNVIHQYRYKKMKFSEKMLLSQAILKFTEMLKNGELFKEKEMYLHIPVIDEKEEYLFCVWDSFNDLNMFLSS